MGNMKESIIETKSFKFALKVIKVCQEMQKKNEFVISRQLLKSWTSIWANIEEAGSGQSKKDFLAKMYISLKESKETRYWLKLIKESWIHIIEESLMKDIEEIISILTKITKTTSSNIA